MRIKPCPFCGDRGRRRTIDFGGKEKIYRNIECRNKECGVRPSVWFWTQTKSWEIAIKTWNKRFHK
jgi:hypothetical protein